MNQRVVAAIIDKIAEARQLFRIGGKGFKEIPPAVGIAEGEFGGTGEAVVDASGALVPVSRRHGGTSVVSASTRKIGLREQCKHLTRTGRNERRGNDAARKRLPCKWI